MTMTRKRYDWEQVAVMTTTIANCWIGKAHKLRVTDFPYCKEKEQRIDTVEKFKRVLRLFPGIFDDGKQQSKRNRSTNRS